MTGTFRFISRCGIVRIFLPFLLFAIAPTIGSAQPYPVKTVRLVVGFPPGGTLRNGRTLSHFCPAPKGDPANRLTRDEMHSKFMQNATSVFEHKRMEELFDLLGRIDELDNVGVVPAYLSKR